MRLLRKALFGGSFNPPHRAHRALAEQALAQLDLNELVAMPAGQPWQKDPQGLAAGPHRAAMLRLQLQGLPRCRVSTWELDQDGPSYSLHTLAALQQPGERWFLLIGQDQYARLSTWHRVADLLACCELAVAARAGQPVQPDPTLPAHRCTRIDLPADAVSSSAIRQALQAGESVLPLVGPDVAGYIAHHHLYRA